MFMDILKALLCGNSASVKEEESSIYDRVYKYIRYESYENIEYLLDNHYKLNYYKDYLWSDDKMRMADNIASFCERHGIEVSHWSDRY